MLKICLKIEIIYVSKVLQLPIESTYKIGAKIVHKIPKHVIWVILFYKLGCNSAFCNFLMKSYRLYLINLLKHERNT